MSTRGWPDDIRRAHLTEVELRGARHTAERAHEELVRKFYVAATIPDVAERRRTQAKINGELRDAYRERQRAVHRHLAASSRLREMLNARPA